MRNTLVNGLGGLFAVAAAAAQASPVALVLSHQGRLWDAEGKPRNGELTMTYLVYDTPDRAVALGKTKALWWETRTVLLDGTGSYQVVLGDTANDSPEIPEQAFLGNRWLAIEVEGDGEMTPRLRFTSVPYAVYALRVAPGGAGSGTVTHVTAGEGLTGGPIETTGELAVDFTEVAREDHTHDERYVSTVGKEGGPGLRGDVRLKEGANVTLTESVADRTITIASAGGYTQGAGINIIDSTISARFATADPYTGGALTVARSDHSHAALTGWAASGSDLHNTNAGNVGIGTAVPSHRLTVAGNVDIGSQGTLLVGGQQVIDANRNIVSIGSAGEAHIRAASGANLQLEADGATTGDLTVATTGNVGIGTTDPGAKLEVVQDGDAKGVRIRSSDPDDVTLDITTASTRGLYLKGTSTDPADLVKVLDGSDNTLFLVRNDGNVGIGTASPNLSGASTDRVLTVFNANSSRPSNLELAGTSGNNDNTATGVIYFIDSSNTGASESRTLALIAGRTDGATSANRGGALQFYTKANAASPAAERMRITGAGNVGIGTADPGAYKLNVVGSLNAQEFRVNGAVLSTGSGSNWTASGSDIYRLSGNVGVGTSSPTGGRVHLEHGGAVGVYSSGSGSNFLANATPAGIFGHVQGRRNGAVKYYLGLDATDNFAVLNADTSVAMVVDTDGNTGKVGIGTTNPAKKLHVQGGAIWVVGPTAGDDTKLFLDETPSGGKLWQIASRNDGRLQINNATDARTDLNITGAGNVGIGTIGAAYPLEIVRNQDSGAPLLNLSNPSTGTSAITGMWFDYNAGGFIGYFKNTATSYAPAYQNRFVFNSSNNTAGLGVSIIAENPTADIRMYTAGTAAASERMRIDSAGNIGIGTGAPTSKLHVIGGGSGTLARINQTNATDVGLLVEMTNASNANNGLQINKAGTTGAYLSAGGSIFNVMGSGNVGIGTAAPSGRLSVSQSSNTDVDLTLQAGDASRWWLSADHSLNKLLIGADGAGKPAETDYAVAIDSNGNVGIGTTGPVQKLDVNGSMHMAHTSQPLSACDTPNRGTIVFTTVGASSKQSLCLCRDSASGQGGNLWQNVISGTVGTTTSCPE